MFGQLRQPIQSSALANDPTWNSDLEVGNLGLEILQQLGRSNKLHVRRSMAQLRKALVATNSHFNYTQSELNRTSYEMSRHGIDIERLESELEARRTQRLKQQQVRRDVEDCYFYIPNLTLTNLNQFKNKLFEYNMMGDLHESLGRRDVARDIRRRMMGKSLSAGPESVLSSSRLPTTSANLKISLSNRNEAIQRKFNKIVSEYITGGCRLTASQLSRMFFNATNSNVIWAALVRQLENIDYGPNVRTPDLMNQLLSNSIRMIEEENSQALPKEQFAIQSYIKSNILSDPEVKRSYIYYDPKTNRPVWAIVFTLLKAGRIDEINKMSRQIERGGFLEDFQLYISGKLRSRVSWRGDNSDSDMFLDMLYSIFNKDKMVQLAVVQDSTDLLWFILKVINVETNGSDQFTPDELKRMMIERNSTEQSTRSLINLLYCTAYDELLNQVNQKLSIDDTTHMLIILEKMTFCEKGLLSKTRQEYLNILSAYAQDIVNMGLQHSINYILLAYNKNSKSTKNEVFMLLERLIIDRNVIEEFFGGYPRGDSKYQQQINKLMGTTAKDYSDVISNISDMYKRKYNKFVYPALLFNNLLGEPARSLECLIEMKLTSLLEDRATDQTETKDAVELIVKYVKENKPTKEQEKLIVFINAYESMCTAVERRQTTEQLAYNKFTPRGDHLDPDTHQILSSLNSRNAIKLYFLFFEMVISAVDLDCATRADRSAYKAKLNSLEAFFRKLKEHSLVTSNLQTLRPIIAKIVTLLNNPVI